MESWPQPPSRAGLGLIERELRERYSHGRPSALNVDSVIAAQTADDIAHRDQVLAVVSVQRTEDFDPKQLTQRTTVTRF